MIHLMQAKSRKARFEDKVMITTDISTDPLIIGRMGCPVLIAIQMHLGVQQVHCTGQLNSNIADISPSLGIPDEDVTFLFSQQIFCTSQVAPVHPKSGNSWYGVWKLYNAQASKQSLKEGIS